MLDSKQENQSQQDKQIANQTLFKQLAQPLVVDDDKETSKRSQFFEKYMRFFEEDRENINYIRLIHTQQLEKQGITFKATNFESFDINFQASSRDYEVITATISMGYMQLQITILNVLGNCPFRLFQNINRGSQGEIYLIKLTEVQFAIKAYPVKNQERKRQTIIQGLKEYCFLKFCSALRCGPYAEKFLGFDVVVYSDYLIFAMEWLQTIRSLNEQSSNQLKHQLKIIHSFGFAHNDIKPENIGFSPHFNKAVLIDFGLSEFIEAQFGEKTKTFFRGSFCYCGQEMLNLFLEGQYSGYVDMYYNDVVCFEKTISLMKIQGKDIDISGNDHIDLIGDIKMYDKIKRTEKEIFTMKIKYYLSISAHLEAKELLKQSRQFKHVTYKNILIFMKKIIPLQTFHEETADFLKLFEGTSEYEEIFLNLQQNANIIKHKSLDQSVFNEQQQQFVEEFQRRYELFAELSSFQSERAYIQNLKINKILFLQSYKITEDIKMKHMYFDIYIDCVRFDSTRFFFNLDQKNELFYSFQQNFLNLNVKSRNIIDNLRQSFIFLLQYCLNSPRVYWINKNIYIILKQCVLLDLDITKYFQGINQYISRLSTSNQKIFSCLNVYKINCLLSYKYKSAHEHKTVEIYMFFSNLHKQLSEQCIDLSQGKQSSTKSELLSQIFIFLKRPNCQITINDVIEFNNKISKVQKCLNFYLSEEIIIYMFYQQALRYIYCKNLNFIFDLYKIFKPTLSKGWTQKCCFQLEYITSIGLQFSCQTEFTTQINLMVKRAKKIINCEQISSMFKFDMVQFLASGSSQQNKLYETIIQLKKGGHLVCLAPLNREYNKVGEIIKNAHLKIPYSQSIHKLFGSIDFGSYYAISYEQSIHLWEENAFDNIRKHAISFVMLQKSKEQGHKEFEVLRNHFISMANKVHDITGCQICKYKLLLAFKIYLAIFSMHHHYSEASFRAYYEWFDLAKALNLWKMIYYALVNIVTISNIIVHYSIPFSEKSWLTMAHYQFYLWAKEKNNYIYYYSVPSRLFIYYALVAFKQTENRTLLYDLLFKLGESLTSNDASMYIDEWFINAKYFCHDHPSYFTKKLLDHHFPPLTQESCYAVCYYVLCLNQENSRALLLKINKYLLSINHHTRNIILGFYYKNFINLPNLPKRAKTKLQLRVNPRYKESQNTLQILSIKKKYKKQDTKYLTIIHNKMNSYLT